MARGISTAQLAPLVLHAVTIIIHMHPKALIPYMLDQRPLLYKGRTQIVASLASKMKHLVAALK